jgi:hypothetical protein
MGTGYSTDVERVRNKDGGRLYEDCVCGRLLMMPPAACALLALLNRNYNVDSYIFLLFTYVNSDLSFFLKYTAQKIVEINERGTYVREFVGDDKMAAEQKITAQDDEIFQRARLLNCAHHMQIILGRRPSLGSIQPL